MVRQMIWRRNGSYRVIRSICLNVEGLFGLGNTDLFEGVVVTHYSTDVAQDLKETSGGHGDREPQEPSAENALCDEKCQREREDGKE